MGLPSQFDPKKPGSERGATVGHEEEGRTIGLHSLSILPSHQKKGLGRTLLKSYIQRMQAADIADRIALIAHGHLVDFYKSEGFLDKGQSEAQFGGGGWIDMVRELEEEAE
jgi:GNAT superfamily N-acetyltransferase